MAHYFPGLSTTRQIWFDGLVGRYGWLDTSFPVWVDNLALIPAVLLAILAIRELVDGSSDAAQAASSSWRSTRS